MWLINFPLPPSVNEYLMPVAGKMAITKTGRIYRKGHLVKTAVHKHYSFMCQSWANSQGQTLINYSNQLKDLVARARREKKQIGFRVDMYFLFHVERIWTKNNIPEQLDADNRVKPARDALAKILGIDDKYFFSGFFEKATTNSKELECTIIRVTAMTPRTREEIIAEMRKNTDTSS